MNLMIPAHMQEEALRAYRDGDSPQEIHRALWPAGGAPCTPHTLRTILDALCAQEDAAFARSQASDELPEELRDAEEALRDQRKRLRTALDAGEADVPGDDGGPARYSPLLDKLLIENVKAHVAVSAHRLRLQRHRAQHAPPPDLGRPSTRRVH